MNKRKFKKVGKKILDKGNGIVGDVVGAITNASFNDLTGITGTLVKEAICGTIKTVANKLETCQLTEWEINRVNNCMKYSIDKIKSNIQEDKQIRNDGFFDKTFNNKSDAEEVFESVVIASQRDSQEIKQIFYGNILANSAFEENLNADEINFIIKVFEKLTYRQCLLLSVFYQNYSSTNMNIKSFLKDYNLTGNIDETDGILYQEIFDLYNKSLIFTIDKEVLFNIFSIVPSNLITLGLGNTVVKLAELDKIIKNKVEFKKKHLEDLIHVYEKFIDKYRVNMDTKDVLEIYLNLD